jgi:thiol-disulfide isomerase/thioredoxin
MNMNRRLGGFLCVSVLAIGCGGDGSSTPSKPQGSLSAGNAGEARKKAREEMAKFKSFPFNFELPDIHGENVSLKDYAGKVLIVDFWGTWCPPCREEIPDFIELYKQYHNAGLDIVGINYEQEDEPAEAVKRVADFVKKHEIPYECVMGDDGTRKQVPGFDGYPTTLFVDRAGKVRMMLDSRHERPELEAFVTVLLEEQTAPGR